MPGFMGTVAGGPKSQGLCEGLVTWVLAGGSRCLGSWGGAGVAICLSSEGSKWILTAGKEGWQPGCQGCPLPGCAGGLRCPGTEPSPVSYQPAPRAATAGDPGPEPAAGVGAGATVPAPASPSGY